MVCTFKHSILLNFSPSTFSPDKLSIFSPGMFVQYWSALPEPPLPTLSDSIFWVERRRREKCPFIYLVSKVMQIQSGLQEIPPPPPPPPPFLLDIKWYSLLRGCSFILMLFFILCVLHLFITFLYNILRSYLFRPDNESMCRLLATFSFACTGSCRLLSWLVPGGLHSPPLQ